MATVTAGGAPRIIPIVFAVVDDTLYSAVDRKPKTTQRLHRLANIRATGRASILVDHYDEDWTALWWVRVDGPAQVLKPDSDEGGLAIDALTGKYPQYDGARPTGPVIRIDAHRWTSWTAG